MLKMCFDKRVVGGLALVGVGVFVFAPNLFTAALPFLFVLACPLSMLLMAKTMMGGSKTTPTPQSMDPEIVTPKVGSTDGEVTTTESARCPTCGAALGMNYSPKRLSPEQRHTTASEHHYPEVPL